MAELITKDQVIDWFPCYGHMDKPIPYDVLVTDIQAMDTVDAATAQQWIPVTERLPERDVQVLGWYKDNPFSQYRPEVVAWNGNGWVFVYAHRYVTNVTHWMPLPEEPEEGGKA